MVVSPQRLFPYPPPARGVPLLVHSDGARLSLCSPGDAEANEHFSCVLPRFPATPQSASPYLAVLPPQLPTNRTVGGGVCWEEDLNLRRRDSFNPLRSHFPCSPHSVGPTSQFFLYLTIFVSNSHMLLPVTCSFSPVSFWHTTRYYYSCETSVAARSQKVARNECVPTIAIFDFTHWFFLLPPLGRVDAQSPGAPGRRFSRRAPGQVCRGGTGSPLPKGLDCVELL